MSDILGIARKNYNKFTVSASWSRQAIEINIHVLDKRGGPRRTAVNRCNSRVVIHQIAIPYSPKSKTLKLSFFFPDGVCQSFFFPDVQLHPSRHPLVLLANRRPSTQDIHHLDEHLTKDWSRMSERNTKRNRSQPDPVASCKNRPRLE